MCVYIYIEIYIPSEKEVKRRQGIRGSGRLNEEKPRTAVIKYERAVPPLWIYETIDERERSVAAVAAAVAALQITAKRKEDDLSKNEILLRFGFS